MCVAVPGRVAARGETQTDVCGEVEGDPPGQPEGAHARATDGRQRPGGSPHQDQNKGVEFNGMLLV